MRFSQQAMVAHAIASTINCPDPLKIDFLERTRLS